MMACCPKEYIIMSLNKEILKRFEDEHGISLKEYGKIIDKKYEEKYKKEIEIIENNIEKNLIKW